MTTTHSRTTEAEAPKANLVRALPFEVTRAEENTDGLTLDGYAAIWDSPTLINSWEGYFTETIRKGAFRKTISERTPVLQFDHGSHPLIGSLPIGVITSITEDDRGLRVVARLHADPLFAPVREAIASGAINGMSFRFDVVRDAWDYSDEVPSRDLIEVKCREAGPVVFPAYVDTEVSIRQRGVEQIAMALRDEQIRELVMARLAPAAPAPQSTESAPADDGHPDPAPEAPASTSSDAPSRAAHPSKEARLAYLTRVDDTLKEK